MPRYRPGFQLWPVSVLVVRQCSPLAVAGRVCAPSQKTRNHPTLEGFCCVRGIKVNEQLCGTTLWEETTTTTETSLGSRREGGRLCPEQQHRIADANNKSVDSSEIAVNSFADGV
jgi:hypothetical protein